MLQHTVAYAEWNSLHLPAKTRIPSRTYTWYKKLFYSADKDNAVSSNTVNIDQVMDCESFKYPIKLPSNSVC